MRKKKSSYRGLQENIRKSKLPGIETWENKYKDKNYTVHLETSEFTCICPKTGLGDFATLYLDYIPDKLCVELKSFKLYLHSFRDLGIFHEHAANRILDDFVHASKPRWARLRAEFNLRGGIKTTVEREYTR
ncbi:MAG: NADPH-dependent 7-cyano-7-deazaguanine reductase QueF [Candidatus Omnitrophota bacterium]|nr:MAG: NADPH-dependent 7-cyano-7-deazaguanine reductase QueF [Candidatus Omnitrophota bacterium]